MSEQPEKVREAIGKLVESLSRLNKKTEIITEDSTGEEIYEAIADELEYDEGRDKFKAASLLLNEYGVKGIAYEGMTDGPAAVVFDDQAIQILETYYQSLNLGNRGRTDFRRHHEDNRAPIILNLFQNADISTVVHELNHIFVDDLIELVRSGRGGEEALRHFNVLDAFAGGKLRIAIDSPDDYWRDKAKWEPFRDAMETVAEAWEYWAMEGKAPSADLEEPFEVIRRYMTRIYRDASQLAEPSGEVRRVFDAFLATDEQIENEAKVREMQGNWAAHSSEEIRKRLEGINKRRDERKRARLNAEAGGGRELRKSADYDGVRRTARNELAEQPVYRALDYVAAKGGLDRALAEAEIGKDAADKLAARHEGIFAEKDGASPEDAARTSGYEAAGDMLSDLLDAKTLNEAADDLAWERLDSQDIIEEAERAAADDPEDAGQTLGEMDDEKEQDADTADMIEEVELAVENAETDGGRRKFGREAARRLQEWRNKQQAMKNVARRYVWSKPIMEATDVRPFRTAKKKAQKNAGAAGRRGDWEKAASYKEEEMLHHYEMEAARYARKLRDRILEKYSARRLRNAIDKAEHKAKVENEYANGIRELTGFTGIATSRFLRQGDDNATLVLPRPDASLGGLIPDINNTLDDWMANKQKPPAGNWRNYTVEQVREIDRVMRWLLENGRGALKALKDAEAADLDQLVEKSTAPMSRRADREAKLNHDDRKFWGRKLNNLNRFMIQMTLPETWFEMMDGNPAIGGKEAGPNQRTFWKVRQAQEDRDLLYRDTLAIIKPHLDTMTAFRKRIEKLYGGRTFAIAGLPVPEVLRKGRNVHGWDADLLISVALNMGNDANLARLLANPDPKAPFDPNRYNFTPGQLETLARQFTAAEWQAVQGVWDGLDTLYDPADQVTFRLTNRHVNKEQPKALIVQTSDGQTLTLKGGYFPLVNDPMLHLRACRRA
ncbi:MAG: hypothetical protein LBE84_09875 [Planctomycetota bacterium]|nr:hypothetical protein [Planctomycetota bacterium]